MKQLFHSDIQITTKNKTLEGQENLTALVSIRDFLTLINRLQGKNARNKSLDSLPAIYKR